MNISKKHIIILASIVVLAIIVIPTFRWVFPPRHQHCIKQATFLFLEYAEENNGLFPQSDRGWGDALLKIGDAENHQGWLPYIVGVDDDGLHLLQALRDGTDVDEELCTRVYVQGLHKDSHGGIAILFDRDSVRGGDHFRSPFRKPVREVITVDGMHRMIDDAAWPDFVDTQRTLLRERGFDDTQIATYYGQY